MVGKIIFESKAYLKYLWPAYLHKLVAIGNMPSNMWLKKSKIYHG